MLRRYHFGVNLALVVLVLLLPLLFLLVQILNEGDNRVNGVSSTWVAGTLTAWLGWRDAALAQKEGR